MSVPGLIGICWLGFNAALFAALAVRKPRPRLQARLFEWFFQTENQKLSASVAPQDRTRRSLQLL
jgi:hypothetical protein